MNDDLYIESKIDEHRSICISTLARSLLDDGDVGHLGKPSGYYIYEVDDRPILGGIIVLAKAASSEAALRLAEVWRSSREVLPNKG